MSISAKQKFIAVKQESTPGTEDAPANTDAVLTSNLQITPYGGNVVSRDFDRTELGNSGEINTGPNVQISFDVELAGSGTAGTAPAWSALLEACGFDITVSASTSVAYNPISTGYKSVTIYYYIGSGTAQQMHKMIGALGTVSFSLGAGEIPKMSFTFTSKYTSPVSTGGAPISADVSDYIAPLPVTAVNTPTYELDSVAVFAESLSFDMAVSVVYRNIVGNESVTISDRAPGGTFGIEAPDIDTVNYFTSAESHQGITTIDGQIVHGLTAGNIITFDWPAIQLSGIDPGNSDDILTYNIGARMLPVNGDDEFILTLT